MVRNLHVPIWHPLDGRKVTGNAAPLKQNLQKFLRKNPFCEIYIQQDKFPERAEAARRATILEREVGCGIKEGGGLEGIKEGADREAKLRRERGVGRRRRSGRKMEEVVELGMMEEEERGDDGTETDEDDGGGSLGLSVGVNEGIVVEEEKGFETVSESSEDDGQSDVEVDEVDEEEEEDDDDDDDDDVMEAEEGMEDGPTASMEQRNMFPIPGPIPGFEKAKALAPRIWDHQQIMRRWNRRDRSRDRSRAGNSKSRTNAHPSATSSSASPSTLQRNQINHNKSVFALVSSPNDGTAYGAPLSPVGIGASEMQYNHTYRRRLEHDQKTAHHPNGITDHHDNHEEDDDDDDDDEQMMVVEPTAQDMSRSWSNQPAWHALSKRLKESHESPSLRPINPSTTNNSNATIALLKGQDLTTAYPMSDVSSGTPEDGNVMPDITSPRSLLKRKQDISLGPSIASSPAIVPMSLDSNALGTTPLLGPSMDVVDGNSTTVAAATPTEMAFSPSNFFNMNAFSLAPRGRS